MTSCLKKRDPNNHEKWIDDEVDIFSALSMQTDTAQVLFDKRETNGKLYGPVVEKQWQNYNIVERQKGLRRGVKKNNCDENRVKEVNRNILR